MTSTIEDLINHIAPPANENLPPLNDNAWENIAITAIVLGLAPLLHWRLEQLAIPLPPMIMAKLAITRQAHAARNQAIAQQLAEILAACAQYKIDVLVLKGAFLAPTAYPEAALRPMNDIDLLFRPADLARLGPIMASLGYQGKFKDAEQGPGITKHLSTYRRTGNNGATPNPYLSAAADRMVEPHGSLEESWFGLKVDITPGVWERAIPTLLHGQPAYRLATPDLLLHLCVHATFHVIMAAAVFVQLHDLGRVLTTWSTELDWEQFLILNHRAAAQPFSYAALYWANKLYRTAVPEALLQSLRAKTSPGLVRYIHSLDANGLLKRTQQPPLVSLNQRLRRGLADRAETARWAATWSQKWHVWQTALAIHKTDTASLLLGKPLKSNAESH